MMTLFDDDYILEAFAEDIKNQTAYSEARETAKRMIKTGKLSLEEIGDYTPALSMDELKELEVEVMQLT